MKLFWPTSRVRAGEGQLLGWRIGESLVGVAVVDQSTTPDGSISSRQPSESLNQRNLHVLARVVASKRSVSSTSSDLTIWVTPAGLPAATSHPVEVIFFDPPDPSRLRFLTLTEGRSSTVGKREAEIRKQDDYSISAQRPESKDELENVLPLLNAVHRVQRALHSSRSAVASTNTTIPRDVPTPSASDDGPIVAVDTLVRPILLIARGMSIGGIRLSLREQFAAVSQICLRLEQLAAAPAIWRKSVTRADIDLPARSKHYMLFWNTVWLVLNDLILGYCARQFILQISPVIGPHIKEAFSRYLFKATIDALEWLNAWPVGLKLNTPLSQFFCTTLGTIIGSCSGYVLPALDTLIPIGLACLATASFGGLTLVLAMMVDTLNLLTLHLYLCSAMTNRLSRWQLSSLGGLWNLFRGKRWNVLRQRTDSYAYEIDQLFLGTLLFTVSIFLLPTVLTYAALFALTRLGVVIITKALQLSIKSLNAFPLFELMLRIKEPSRLPSGITFTVRRLDPHEQDGLPAGSIVENALVLVNAPKSLLDIFRAY